MLNFYDFETFKHDWMVVIINPVEESETDIVNDPAKLADYYDKHKDQIWIGYNSRSYDQYILKAILRGMNPWEVNDWIINKGRKGWEFCSDFSTMRLYNYDCMNKFYSLKQLEGFMGNDVEETAVPFDIDRQLTPYELQQTVNYCRHDVEQTMEVFLRTKATFDAHLALIKAFNLPFSSISKTQAQLSALALGCVDTEWNDEFDLQFVDTLRINKYKSVFDWFVQLKETSPDSLKHPSYEEYMKAKKEFYQRSLSVDVCGVPHVFGFGGIHGAPDKPLHKKGCLIHVDVTSFYPSIMIHYDMLSRTVKDKSVYKKIYDTRVALKAAGKKEEQAPYKIILNSTYGICKDPTSTAYDPRQANNVCVNGQLLLLDLLEHLEGHCELIQSNTDGLIIQIDDTDEAFDAVDDICYEWEQRTGMSLGFDYISEIFQKDVNNYIFKFDDGKIERKGAYVKPLNDLDNDLPIVNKALVAYMVDGVPIEKTINDSDALKDFQKIVKITGKYECGWHNGIKHHQKTFRVFASTYQENSFMGKVKLKNGKESIEKFANTPDHCFFFNQDINEVKVDDIPELDKQWYVDFAKKRLAQFGVKV